MLSLFPAHRPCVGIGVNERALRLAIVRRLPFRRTRVSRVGERLLQEGWVTSSASSQNIIRKEALEKELCALTGSLSDRAVAISLADECGTFGVFTFDTLAANHEERERVIRWRFQQEADVKLGREPLVYRLFAGDNTVSVLAAAIDDSVLKQYLALFDAARLLPMSIGFETFYVFDAFRQTMDAGPERFFVHYNGQTLTFMAFQHGRPVFLRKRRIKSTGADVRNELIATLQYFDDRYFRVGTEESLPKLYFVDTSPASGAMARPFESRTTITVPALHRARCVEVTPLDWSALRVKPGKAEVSNALLPVVAGIGVA
jgi:hypothetical protein